MIVVCSPTTGEVTLRETEVFTSFYVEAPERSTTANVSSALGTPEAEPGDHVWLLIDQIRTLAGETTPDWTRDFEAMIEYAAGKGWTNNSGDMLLAHVKTG